MRAITYSGPASRARYWAELYNQAGPVNQAAGRAWYDRARAWLDVLGRAYCLELAAVAGIAAVLSPRIPWPANQAATETLLRAELDGLEAGPIPGFYRNQEKARGILSAALEGRPFMEYIRGPKVSRFHEALTGRPAVVLDAWMMRAAGLPERMAERPKVYQALEAAIIAAAAELDVRPEGLQAAVWLHHRPAE